MWSKSGDRDDRYHQPVPQDSIAFTLDSLAANPAKYSELFLHGFDFDTVKIKTIKQARSLRYIKILYPEHSLSRTLILSKIFIAASELQLLTVFEIEGDFFGHDNDKMIIPDDIRMMRNLRSLSIRGNFIQIPESICELNQLRKLAIGSPNLNALSEEIDHLSNLEELWIYSDSISHLPSTLVNCPLLHYISLDCGSMENLSGTFSALDTLLLFSRAIHSIQVLRELKCFIFDIRNVRSLNISIPGMSELNLESDGKLDVDYFNYNKINGLSELDIKSVDSISTYLLIDTLMIPKLATIQIKSNDKLRIIKISSANISLPSFNFLVLRIQDLESTGGLERVCNGSVMIYGMTQKSFASLIPDLFKCSCLDSLTIDARMIKPVPSQIRKLKFIKTIKVETFEVSDNQKIELTDNEKRKLKRILPHTQITFS